MPSHMPFNIAYCIAYCIYILAPIGPYWSLLAPVGYHAPYWSYSSLWVPIGDTIDVPKCIIFLINTYIMCSDVFFLN